MTLDPPWVFELREALPRALDRLGRHPGRIAELAPEMARAAARAWTCYTLGAAGALLDLLDTFDRAGIAPPPEIAAERDDLIEAALRGEAAAPGQGKRAPLAAHAAALRRRLRGEAVRALLDDAVLTEHQDREAERTGGFGLGGAYWADRARWPEMAPAEWKACCEHACGLLGEAMVGWRVLYDDARAFAAERRALGADWPGPFYLPARATCERLGLEAGLRLIDGGWAAPDAPWWEWP